MHIHLNLLFLAKLVLAADHDFPVTTPMSKMLQRNIVHDELASYENRCVIKSVIQIIDINHCSITIPNEEGIQSMHPFFAVMILHALPAQTQGWHVDIDYMEKLRFSSTTVFDKGGEWPYSKRYVRALDYTGFPFPSGFYSSPYIQDWLIRDETTTILIDDLKECIDRVAKEFLDIFGEDLFEYRYAETTADVISIILERPLEDIPTSAIVQNTIGAPEAFAHMAHSSINGASTLYINVFNKYAFTVEQAEDDTLFQEASLTV